MRYNVFRLRYGHRVTWRVFLDHLTPEQVAHLERCDANPDHPGGPEWHRRGMIVMAQMAGQCGPGGLN